MTRFKKGKKLRVINIDNKSIKYIDSVEEAAIYFEKAPSTISNYVDKNRILFYKENKFKIESV